MEHSFAVVAGSLILGLLSTIALAEPISLYTFHSPPYQIVKQIPSLGAQVTGLTVDTVMCATRKAGRKATVTAVPQRRAIQSLRNDVVDGYFAVTPAPYLGDKTNRSHPVSLEKWYLVSRANERRPEKPRIGAVIGSSEEAWLRANSHEIFLSVRTAAQLIELLKRHRIDQAVMDQRVFASLENTDGLNRQFVRYVPLHLYVSEAFSRLNPGFLEAFNHHIPECVNEGFDLTLEPSETRRIRSTAHTLFRKLRGNIPIVEALRDSPKISNLSEIMNLDVQWRAMAPERHSPLAKHIAGLDASIAMTKWQKNHQALVNEVILTNNIGTVAAMSHLTTDFWQGDEAKFTAHIDGKADDVYISPIYYDESTARFQIIVSIPIVDQKYWQPAGVLILGLDAERTLAAKTNPLFIARNTTY